MDKKEPGKSRHADVPEGHVRAHAVLEEWMVEEYEKYRYWYRRTARQAANDIFRFFFQNFKFDPNYMDERGRLRELPEDAKEVRRRGRPKA